MHVFLTGDVQVGKSTLIRKTVENLPGLRIGGFRSVTVADIPGAIGAVYLVRGGSSVGPGWDGIAKRRMLSDFAGAGANSSSDRLSAEEVLGEANRIGIRWGQEKGAEGFPEVFETTGIEILQDAEGCDLILMDEIGWMEGSTTAFRQRVMDLLEGSAPILGVVQKRWNTPLQEHIRNHPQVHLVTVNEENRDELLPFLAEWLDSELRKKK